MIYLVCTLALLALTQASRSHVVFIVIDDLGFDDVGFRSHEIKTPAIDKLANDGIVLDQYYVQDVCSPSRATFMTGRYAMHHGVVDWIPPQSAYGLPLTETTLARKFNRSGYSTHMAGKWHCGSYKWEMTPTFRGFNTFKGFYGGGEDYFTHQSDNAYDFRTDSEPHCGKGCSQVNWQDEGVYSTTVFTTEAVRVVNNHEDVTGDDTPMFLYLAYQGVHSPPQVPQSYVTPYNDLIADPFRRTFAGMLSAVDEGIGNVTQALKAKGMFDNTLFIFTSDNGGPTETGDHAGARNWPLRGGKHSVWEGGVRATAFISGKGISSQPDYTGLMHGADWFTTLADVAGYDLTGTQPLDGVSHWAQLSKGSKDIARKSIVLGNATNNCYLGDNTDDPRFAKYRDLGFVDSTDKPECGFAIRDGKWKLIQGYGGFPQRACNSSSNGLKCGDSVVPYESGKCPGNYCLYDVSSDPTELQNVYNSTSSDVTEKLISELEQVLKSYNQYTEDKSCPPFKKGNDPHVGATLEPWC